MPFVLSPEGHPGPHGSLGANGIGEIGITGVGAAVANAIYNATGKRIRADHPRQAALKYRCARVREADKTQIQMMGHGP